MDIFQLLKEWFYSERTEVEPSLLAYVLLYSTQQTTGIIELIDYLKTIWKQGEITYKVKCIELLAQVVTPSQSSLDATTVDAILRFIGGHLKDNVALARCIDILSVLMQTDTISSTNTIELCEILFHHIKIRKQSQPSRLKVLMMLSKSVERYPSELQRSKIAFIDGFINCMDGEKDPRNLLVAFDLVRAIIDRFDISRHIEDLFEVVFCYFPISFAAPNHADSLGITTDDLKISLRRCLAATPYFAFYATPLLIEKLLTTKGSAKKDAMETVSLCAPAYGAHAILPHAQDLFDALVKEVYEGMDAAMVEIALQTIHHVVATLGTGISIANIRDPVERAIDGLLQKCVQELKQPELKHARSAASILRAAASASDPACTSVTHIAVPIIYQQFTSIESAGQKKAILDILTELLIASKTLYGSVEDVGYDRDFQTPLLMYKQQILQMFILSLADSTTTNLSVKQASLKGFHEMVLMKHFLKKEEIHVAIGHLTHQLVLQEKDIRQLALSILDIIAKLYPVSIGQHTFPVLLDTLASRESPTLSDHYKDALGAIEVLGAHAEVFMTVIDSLIDRLDFACCFIGQRHLEYVHDLATTLLSAYRIASKHTDVVALGQNSILPFLLRHCFPSTSLKPWHLDDVLIETFATIIAVTMRLSSASQQSKLVQDAFRLFLNGDLSVLDSNSMSQEDPELSILSVSDNHRTDITLLFTAIVCNCRRDIQLPVYDLPDFLKKSIQTAIQTPCKSKRMALTKIASSIINKSKEGQFIHAIQQMIKEELMPHLRQSAPFTIFIWMIKSFIQKGHTYGFELLDSVIQMCGFPDIGKEAADSFIVLLQQDELVLNKASHAIVSVLYKQRVFNHCFRKLMKGSEQTDILHPEIQIYHLTALIHLVQHIPQQITINELSKLMMPITLALSTQDTHLVQSTLEVVQHIVPDAQDLVIPYLGSFIHALLRVTQSHTASIRILALDCLCEIAKKGKPEVLSPFRPSVVKELGIVLDDKKRIVRKNAVDCREKWFTIGK